MYVIVNVMFGVPLADSSTTCDDDRSQALRQLIDEHDTDPDLIGMHAFYHGGSDLEPASWGAIVRSFDECTHHTESPSALVDVPTHIQAAVWEAWDNMDADLKQEISKFGTPRAFLLWSTS